jgi:cytoskeleton protein RodZ
MAKKNNIATTEIPKGLGQKLKNAREAKNITIDTIAKQLRLSQQRIIEIEADDYSNVTSPIFVLGYLRGYARLLDIADEEINQELNKINLNVKSASADCSIITFTSQQNINPKVRRYLRWFNIGIVILVLVLVLIWWNGRKIPSNIETVSDDNMIQQVIIPDTTSDLTAGAYTEAQFVPPAAAPKAQPKPTPKPAPVDATSEQPKPEDTKPNTTEQTTQPSPTPEATLQNNNTATNNNPPADPPN